MTLYPGKVIRICDIFGKMYAWTVVRSTGKLKLIKVSDQIQRRAEAN